MFTIEKGMSRPLKSIPDYKQKKGECERAFLNRVEKQTKVVIATSQFEDKFGVSCLQHFYLLITQGLESVFEYS